MKRMMDAMYQQHYSDMPREQFDQMCGCCSSDGATNMDGRPNHEDLQCAAVTGQDSMDLQNMEPEVKPAVKMTAEQFAPIFAKGIPGKVAIILEDGTTYVIDYSVTDPVEAMEKIMEGDDSELLGYPEKGEEDAAVTKQGDVVTDLGMMRQHADAGNLAWAASGNGQELMDKAGAVSQAIKRQPEDK